LDKKKEEKISRKIFQNFDSEKKGKKLKKNFSVQINQIFQQEIF